MRIIRRKTKQIHVGSIPVGGGVPVSVQSMIKAPPEDASAIMKQIRALERSGCEIIRLAVPNRACLPAFSEIVKKSKCPVIADIHFDHRLALLSISSGAAAVRINPGNIGGAEPYIKVMQAARNAGVAVRAGVNAGSLEKDLLDKYRGPAPEALVESALRAVEIADKIKFTDLKVSLKASGVTETIDAYRQFSKQCDAPLHIGVTEAGAESTGAVRSAVGLGVLLADGIGDTMRVSLSAPPVAEIRTAWQILSALDIRHRGVTVVSCPTCGRAGADIASIVKQLEKRVSGLTVQLKVAVMGCPVNGPGEAREADLGAAVGGPTALIFKKGEIIKKVKPSQVLDELLAQILQIASESGSRI